MESCWLSNWQEKYVGKTLDEILFLQDSEKAVQRGNAHKEMTSRVDLSFAIDGVIAEAEQMARQTIVPQAKAERTKNIRDNRRIEKTANRRDEAFLFDSERAETITPSEKQAESDSKDSTISPIMAMIKQQLEERLNDK